MKSEGWRIFLSAIWLFSSGMVIGEDDREELVEEFGDGCLVHSCWGGWTVISSGAAEVTGCFCGKGVDSQCGVAIC